MHDAAQVIGWLAAASLIVAVGSWLKLLLQPAVQSLDGGASASVGRVEVASQLIALAVGLSAVAALLAIAGLFTT